MEYRIPDSEFEKRWKKVIEGVREKGLDILICHSNESDFANVRYLSDYWPIFETAGVAISKKGKLALLIGPESETFAEDRSKIKNIYKILQYRESAEPNYPDMKLDDFSILFKELVGDKVKKIGISG
ncbi:MAG: aminopeptidase P family N-terminal domain-containing protein, partial [Candidatus Omnitrophica bacterium]|nr:aminopeptidase P family N-terminal domain-containing protein [Candidatus Omnitrophota bacterium]